MPKRAWLISCLLTMAFVLGIASPGMAQDSGAKTGSAANGAPPLQIDPSTTNWPSMFSGGVTTFSSDCPSGDVCLWSGTGYAYDKATKNCSNEGQYTYYGSFGGYGNSAKNRCPSRRLFLWSPSGYAVKCIAANNEQPSLPDFYYVQIGGGTCAGWP